MTQTQIIASHIIDRMLANAEVEVLGYLATCCELFAESEIGKDRAELIDRASHYRCLQLAALSDL